MLKTLKTLKIKALVEFLPGWALVALSTAGGGIWGYIQSSSTDVLKDASGGNWKGLEVIGVHALIAGMASLLAYLKTDPWTAAASQVAQAKKAPTVPPLAILLMAPLTALLLACTPAQTAELKSIENVVLADVEAQAPDAQIVADVVKVVATNIPATPAEVAFATALAADAITFLVDSGIIPPNYLAQAKAHQASLKTAAGK